MNVNQIKILTYIYLTALLLATLLPLNAQDSALNNNYTLSVRWDYLLHALVYIPLPALAFATVRIRTNSRSHQFANNSRQFEINADSRSTNKLIIKDKLAVILISLTIATGLELLQMLVPYRSFNINDLLANGVGVMLGWVLLIIVGKSINPRSFVQFISFEN